MAARRLIIVLVVLLAISIAAASIAPDRRGGLIGGDSTSTSASTTTTTATSPPAPTGGALMVRIDASAARPEAVEAFVGDQLELNVGSERAREIEIADFGVTEVAAPYAPADFSLLLREAGRLPITDADTGQILGRLVIRERPADGG